MIKNVSILIYRLKFTNALYSFCSLYSSILLQILIFSIFNIQLTAVFYIACLVLQIILALRTILPNTKLTYTAISLFKNLNHL